MAGDRLEAFYLPAEPGSRFALFHMPKAREPRGGILYVHPFGEELNKSRRMAAVQARAFAHAGFSVLLVDLYGCGDSDGDLADARWELWHRDLDVAYQWLAARVDGPLTLWASRLGASLALDWQQAHRDRSWRSALLWQPVVSGTTFITQFLRMAVAADALGADAGTTTDDLRTQLVRARMLEIGGYQLPWALVSAIDAIDLNHWQGSIADIHWLEIKTTASLEPAPAVGRTIERWRERGSRVDYRSIAGSPFWATQEVIEIPELVAATTSCLERSLQ